MAASTSDVHDLTSLAVLLRNSGDRVLSGNSKLRLTSALLTKLNSAFSNISLASSGGDFLVTSAHASQPLTTAQIHFLHDFVQKTVGLAIAGNCSNRTEFLKSQTIDLSRFRSLRHLELRSCLLSHSSDPDRGLEGLSSLRLQLEALVLLQVYHPDDLLWAALAGGAVSVEPDVIWTKLSQLAISYCRLQSFGRGLPLACHLQWLDVSHNMLSDADAIGSSLAALPKLSYLNLSFNRLTRVPVPSYGSACHVPSKLQILLLSHNYIENLKGIQQMTSLKELNLEVNQLESHSKLQPLRCLYQLQHIKLRGNPISYHKRHRILAASYFPPRAVFLKFMLDGQKLNEHELQAVRDGPLCSSAASKMREHISTDAPIEPITVDKTPEPSGVSSSEMDRSTTRKTRKVREAIIEDFDTLEELTDNNFSNNLIAGSIESSGEHLQTKRQLENVKAHFKEDWLRSHAGSTVQELLGLQPPSAMAVGSSHAASITHSLRPLSSSTPIASPGIFTSIPLVAPYPEHLDEQQILESIILKKSIDIKDPPDAFHLTQSSQYLTANESDTVLHLSTGNDETLCGKNSPNVEYPLGYDADEDEDDDSDPKDTVNTEDIGGGDSSKYLVTKIVQGQQSRDLFLLTSPKYIKEIDPSSGSVIQHWRINSLESSVLLSASPCQVQLTFNTVVPLKKKRVYEMDPSEAQKQLLPSLKAILESRSLSALNVAAFRCMRCSGEFSIEMNSRKASKICPTCGSTLVFELDEAPLPFLGTPNHAPSKSLEITASESTTVGEPSCNLLHSPSDSSIGSAVSLESPECVVQPTSEFVQTISTSLRRCESDIDIISNPSQSSIEILDDVSRTCGTPGRKRSSEERQVVAIPSLVTVPELSNPLSPLQAGLTESSSSGSITDSVCTAYESNISTGGMGLRQGTHGLAKSVLKEESGRENLPNFQEEQENVQPSSQPASLLDNLLQTMSSKFSASENSEKLRNKNPGSGSAIQYNYLDFSTVDHRLKLHLHLAILDADEREVIQFLLRGEVLTGMPENQYPGILLVSSQKLYILKITGPEEGDAVDRWISRVVAVPSEKLQSITVLPWGLGISVSLQEIPEKPLWTILTSPSENHSQAVSNTLQDIVSNELPDVDSSIKLTVLLSSNIISKDNVDKNQTGGLLLVTATNILMNSDEWTWLWPSKSSPSASAGTRCIGKQSISNLIQVEATDVTLVLQFLDEAAGAEEVWKLIFQSVSVLEQVVLAIRPSWEELFSVPLQVLPISNT